MSRHQIRILRESETKEDVIKDIICQAEKDEESFMIIELDDIVRKVVLWRQLLPRVDLFYAVKCNPEPAIIRTLKSLGCGFDCASKNEIRSVLGAGADSSRIIFANPVKRTSYLRYAAKTGVALLTFDNQDELYNIKQNHPLAKLLLRIRCDDKDAAYLLGSKFGAELEEAESLLRRAKNLNLDMVGVAFHIGSGFKNPSTFAEAISASRKVFHMAERLGFQPYLLDIGGGFSGAKNGKFEEAAKVISHHLDLHFPDDGHIKVIAEPGCYVVETSGTLGTLITGRRRRKDPSSQREVMEYYINDGTYGSFISTDFPVPVPLSSEGKKGTEKPTTIFGQTCCSRDVVCKDVTLPIMQVGEWLMWEDMGAYSLTLGSSFNGFEPPQAILLKTTEFLDSSLLD